MNELELLLNYELPPERIAQRPIGKGEARADSRLLHVAPQPLALAQYRFRDLPEILRADDLIVFNNTKVRSARFFISVDGREGEILLLENRGEEWRAVGRPMKRFSPGMELELAPGLLLHILEVKSEELRAALKSTSSETVDALIERFGSMPIPPYIRKGRADEEDRESYQTIFAAHLGSAAAPTASLHFTPSVLEGLSERGVETAEVTLHVGAASFKPIRNSYQHHDMSSEQFEISAHTLQQLTAAKAQGRRIIAVGTTVVRALESARRSEDWESAVEQQRGLGPVDTKLYITPGFEFRIVDAMITNFHQPQSTHLLLVSSFAGASAISAAYEYALREKFRFLSYGDALLLEKA